VTLSFLFIKSAHVRDRPASASVNWRHHRSAANGDFVVYLAPEGQAMVKEVSLCLIGPCM